MGVPQVSELKTFRCPLCGCISFNPHDIEHNYCGFCHMFINDFVATPEQIERIKTLKDRRGK